MARREEWSLPGVSDRRATQPAGMDRRAETSELLWRGTSPRHRSRVIAYVLPEKQSWISECRSQAASAVGSRNVPWVKRTLRGNDVYARTDPAGNLKEGADRRVDIVYKLEVNAKVYRAAAANLQTVGDGPDEVIKFQIRPPKATQSESGPSSSADAIIIYTDGACTGNPGPMGLGAVILVGSERTELSEFLGTGTNNIAELTAIERALQSVPPERRDQLVKLHTDSSYSIGLLSKNWKAKANQELVARIRTLVAQFPRLEFVKVRGHAGIPENERCDELARRAITDR